MTERPIPFSAPMVRQVLAGTKTQTRRVAIQTAGGHLKEPGGHRRWHPADPEATLGCRYGQPGDRLWVREAWRTVAEADALPPRDLSPAHRIWYEADSPHQPGAGRYRPPMFMPRWASRILLEITGVRVERLQDISEADAQAEGINVLPTLKGQACNIDGGPLLAGGPRLAFRDLWQSINGADSWAANPWVWVVAFQRVNP